MRLPSRPDNDPDYHLNRDEAAHAHLFPGESRAWIAFMLGDPPTNFSAPRQRSEVIDNIRIVRIDAFPKLLRDRHAQPG